MVMDGAAADEHASGRAHHDAGPHANRNAGCSYGHAGRCNDGTSPVGNAGAISVGMEARATALAGHRGGRREADAKGEYQ